MRPCRSRLCPVASGAGATIDAITVNGFGSVVSVAWDNNGANYAVGDTILTLTQTLNDPGRIGIFQRIHPADVGHGGDAVSGSCHAAGQIQVGEYLQRRSSRKAVRASLSPTANWVRCLEVLAAGGLGSVLRRRKIRIFRFAYSHREQWQTHQEA